MYIYEVETREPPSWRAGAGWRKNNVASRNDVHRLGYSAGGATRKHIRSQRGNYLSDYLACMCFYFFALSQMEAELDRFDRETKDSAEATNGAATAA